MSAPIIHIRNLSVSYDDKIVLEQIDLDIVQGGLYGVLGPNGAGKSTLFKAILGLLEPNAGTINILGKSIGNVRKKIAYVPQKDEVNWRFPATVEDVVTMGRYPHKGLLQRMNAEDKQIVSQALDDVGMTDFRKRQIGELSGGQQQRVFIARALCQQPEIFMLDEPFVGVDIATEENIIELLQQLADKGRTLLVIHHDLTKVKEYFNHVILLDRKLIAVGTTSDQFTTPNIKTAYAGNFDYDGI